MTLVLTRNESHMHAIGAFESSVTLVYCIWNSADVAALSPLGRSARRRWAGARRACTRTHARTNPHAGTGTATNPQPHTHEHAHTCTPQKKIARRSTQKVANVHTRNDVCSSYGAARRARTHTPKHENARTYASAHPLLHGHTPTHSTLTASAHTRPHAPHTPHTRPTRAPHAPKRTHCCFNSAAGAQRPPPFTRPARFGSKPDH
eukprot:6197882-Pleurochrysis_carterae.AAC.1